MSDSQPSSKNRGDISIPGSVTNSSSGDIILGHGNVIHKTISQGSQSAIDMHALRPLLEDFYDQLAVLPISREERRAVQELANQAIKATDTQQPQPEAVVGKLQQVSQTLDKAGTTVQAGSQLANSVLKIAQIAAPLVAGGASVIAAWFGLHI
ncbi:MAG TPA: hypothetical protein VGD98_07340 [Ktedonobacteraceae bacterium]